MAGKIKHALQYLWQWPEFVWGLWRLSRLQQPIVTIFGGKQLGPDTYYFKLAYELGKKLAEADYGVITGGGPGIMEAPLCGALSTGKKHCALGITIKGVDDPFDERCPRRTIYLSNFATRKWLLIHYSSAFVVFPGGIGTFDELGEIMNLIKVHQIHRLPVILVGSAFWVDFTQWVSVALSQKLINPEFRELFTITDDIDEVVQLINVAHER